MNPPLRIGFLADLHGNSQTPQWKEHLTAAVQALHRAGATLLILPGDLTDCPDAASASRTLQLLHRIAQPFECTLALPGNHDLDHLSKAEFLRNLGQARKTIRFVHTAGGMRLIGLDANFSPNQQSYARGNFDWKAATIPEKHLRWLRDQLNSRIPTIIISHQRLDGEQEHFSVQNAGRIQQILEESGCVKMVIQAHAHQTGITCLRNIPYHTLGAFRDGATPALLEIRNPTTLRWKQIPLPGNQTP
jgi:3',5'-cyclic AMP phosphodiesterase CpdA